MLKYAPKLTYSTNFNLTASDTFLIECNKVERKEKMATALISFMCFAGKKLELKLGALSTRKGKRDHRKQKTD